MKTKIEKHSSSIDVGVALHADGLGMATLIYSAIGMDRTSRWVSIIKIDIVNPALQGFTRDLRAVEIEITFPLNNNSHTEQKLRFAVDQVDPMTDFVIDLLLPQV